MLLSFDLTQVSILASKQGEKSHYVGLRHYVTFTQIPTALGDYFLIGLFYSVKCYSILLACFCLTVWILLQFQTVYYCIYCN